LDIEAVGFYSAAWGFGGLCTSEVHSSGDGRGFLSAPDGGGQSMKIAIVGLGYVGLPLSLQFARSGVTVLGLDIDPAKVEALNQGRSYIKHIESSAIAEAVKAGTFPPPRTFSRIREVEAVIICVPTPLNKNREPDISYIIDTGKPSRRICKRARWWCSNPRLIPAPRTRICAAVLEAGSG
jgi:UDP-N-acetyl-D-glucosamine dehydrogenase